MTHAIQPLLQANLTSVPLIHQGKVRELYALGEHHILLVTTDRVSAFDVILSQGIPNKGNILTQVSRFWFDYFADRVPNHLDDNVHLANWLTDEEIALVKDRSMVIKRLKALPIEAIVRGYLIGSGWKDYQANGSICGIALPQGLLMASKLPQPIFTPSTKAQVGDHDENIDFATMQTLMDANLATQIRDISLKIYQEASHLAQSRGIIIADTKLEFGVDEQGTLHLIDEVLTPDSSRFWDAQHYGIHQSPPSFDKQIIRDYLQQQPWDQTDPAPTLPSHIIERTQQRYQQVADLLCH